MVIPILRMNSEQMSTILPILPLICMIIMNYPFWQLLVMFCLMAGFAYFQKNVNHSPEPQKLKLTELAKIVYINMDALRDIFQANHSKYKLMEFQNDIQMYIHQGHVVCFTEVEDKTITWFRENIKDCKLFTHKYDDLCKSLSFAILCPDSIESCSGCFHPSAKLENTNDNLDIAFIETLHQHDKMRTFLGKGLYCVNVKIDNLSLDVYVTRFATESSIQSFQITNATRLIGKQKVSGIMGGNFNPIITSDSHKARHSQYYDKAYKMIEKYEVDIYL